MEHLEIVLRLWVFPNPNSGDFNVSFTLPLLHKPYDFRIFDIMGRTVFKQKGKGSHENTVHFNIDLANGVYIARLRQGNKSDTYKFVVLK